MSVYLLAALALLHESMRAAGLYDRLEPLSAQARLVVSGCQAAGMLAEDLAEVRRAYEKRFRTA